MTLCGPDTVESTLKGKKQKKKNEEQNETLLWLFVFFQWALHVSILYSKSKFSIVFVPCGVCMEFTTLTEVCGILYTLSSDSPSFIVFFFSVFIPLICFLCIIIDVFMILKIFLFNFYIFELIMAGLRDLTD